MKHKNTKQKPLWLFCSGKGSVGKSLLTTSLACLYADLNGPVVLADLDYLDPNLHTFLGKKPTEKNLNLYIKHLQSNSDFDKIDFSTLINESDIHGLYLLEGLSTLTTHPSSKISLKIVKELSSLSIGDLAIIDTSTDIYSIINTDFLNTITRFVFVTVPEPSFIENSHRFLRRLFLKITQDILKKYYKNKSDVPNQLKEQLTERFFSGHFLSIVSTLNKYSPEVSKEIEHYFRNFTLYIVLNQLKYPNDTDIAFALKETISIHYGIAVKIAGLIPYDTSVSLSARRKKIHLREFQSSIFRHSVEKMIEILSSEEDMKIDQNYIKSLFSVS